MRKKGADPVRTFLIKVAVNFGVLSVFAFVLSRVILEELTTILALSFVVVAWYAAIGAIVVSSYHFIRDEDKL